MDQFVKIVVKTENGTKAVIKLDDSGITINGQPANAEDCVCWHSYFSDFAELFILYLKENIENGFNSLLK